ncbi:4-hydroxybenzoate polyprenyltransferase [Chthoniobacter flavus Ellin428]|uniref:4-hydroxybenzoate polyprenyltransferase n=2 Tax=Chthoniobacter flavus TaxID=191863 RepID=B4CYX5_9BACT|nr:4-hydroxybenzoate polyprenyltransferase [Chthoniobacter flavus Ellin428]TCO89567.1 4-hydroxybenzoate polyprenyltransferase [Chthoniobacter flavus]
MQVMSQSATPRPFLLRFGEFIRFSHTIFALPFALVAMLVAGQGHVPWRIFGWILVCMITARTAAMCFNRLVDWEIDKENPRTKARHTLIGKSTGWLIFGLSVAVLLFATWKLNPLCFYLSPVMLVIIHFYSLTKRFSAYSHFFLGLALSVAPMGAWAAVQGTLLTFTPYVLAAAVLCWVFGFDLIYATLDVDFDRRKGLFSFPARYGVAASLRTAKILHIVAALAFFVFGWLGNLGPFYWAAWAIVLIALVWEHRLANPDNPASINAAFFNVNAVVSMCLLAGVLLNYYAGVRLG